MSHPRLPVLWICGTAAAGKSVTAWALFQQKLNDDATCAYLDIDQVGMVYPESDTDPERLQLKADALNRLIPNYRAAGAQALIVSGILDPSAPANFADRFGDADVTFCLLDPGEVALHERILARGWDPGDAAEAVAETATLRSAEFVDEVIDTKGMTVAEVVDRLSPLLVTIDSLKGRDDLTQPTSSATSDLLVITGARATGTSTVGFGLARSRWANDTLTGFVDLDQINFPPTMSEVGTPSVGFANLATLHELFAGRGASLLIASAHLKDGEEHQHVHATVSNAQAVIVRLRANEDTLKEHVRDRFGGSDARLVGDDLVRASHDHQLAVVAQALLDQQRLDQQSDENLLIDVSGCTVHEVLTQIAGLGLT